MITLSSYDNSTVPGGNNYTTCRDMDLVTGDRDVDSSGTQTCTKVESDYQYCGDYYNADPRCQTGTGPSL